MLLFYSNFLTIRLWDTPIFSKNRNFGKNLRKDRVVQQQCEERKSPIKYNIADLLKIIHLSVT